jgi:glycosyltransferase involved in cell wall biosynthesis
MRAGRAPINQLPATGDSPPVFTVVIPLYNKAAHLRETLASVAGQTFRSFETLVVDDGSTDGSADLVRGEAMAGLRLLSQKNAGPGLARNLGIAEAKGAWVAFLDADDLWLPDHLATLHRIIEACPAVDLVASAYVRGVRETAKRLGEKRPGSAPPRIANFFAEHERVCASAIAVRTTALQASGGFGAKWPGEDLELWTRLSLDHQLAVQDRVTAIYVQETGGAMDSLAGSAPAEHDVIDDPALARVEAALADHRYRAKRGDLERFARQLLLSYVRPSLFHGKTGMARLYLEALRSRGGTAPFKYRVLSKIPSSLLRPAMRGYSIVKGRLRRSLRRAA